MPVTADASTISPQISPIDSGIDPIAACTVAFGKYEKTLKSFSL